MRTGIPRGAEAALLAAAALGGLLFGPVFGVPALLPGLVVVLTTFGVAELCRRRPGLTPWRPLLVLGAGLVAVVETVLPGTTLGGLPTATSLSVLADGALHGWQRTLQSTWPALPEPRLVVFVPLLVLLAALLGLELLHRTRRPLLALVPPLLVVVLSQAYAAAGGLTAVLAGLGLAILAALLVLLCRSGVRRSPLLVAPAIALGLAGAIAAGAVHPTGRPAYSLRDDEPAPVPAASVASPLDDIAARLRTPAAPVFRYTAPEPVDAWPVAVFDDFDGANWRTDTDFRRVGREIAPGPEVSAPVSRKSARVEVTGLTGPWLPSQTWPASVEGVPALVDEHRGTLVAERSAAGARYTVGWWEPETDAAALRDAALDPGAGLGGLREVPPDVDALAERVLPGLWPSFQSALALERYLAENYRLAVGTDLPTGHGWPQLRRFLVEDKRGTSEQFAAAYVVLARLRGIPARLVTGFRAPERPEPDGSFVVRNGNAAAWPEVAVAGVGWVALDPAAGAARSGTGTAGVAAAVARARAELPPDPQLRNPEIAAGSSTTDSTRSGVDWPALTIAVAVLLAAVALAWLAGVPAAVGVRAWRRRRRTGRDAVLGAWAEARDRLRAHGVAVTAGMTVRDLAAAAGPVTDQTAAHGLGALARTVDVALWSGAAPPDADGAAWAAVRAVREGLGRRPWRERLRAALNPVVLRPPR
ncbi:transglutaminaseTgpA domain-containing protein [Amycolatopsis sp.]|uniref:transglutaminase family protein n=1 Tax=Amycolatopsis sp. TaxID=37632 RepID=UPI002D7E549E|nr:transglutaminaseTgpA domain-containing protein [Amycolatopsis sp.]HET6703818.1 transglutaminaseTgpA domain-containing protein [Amycolatopsis sp.]